MVSEIIKTKVKINETALSNIRDIWNMFHGESLGYFLGLIALPFPNDDSLLQASPAAIFEASFQDKVDDKSQAFIYRALEQLFRGLARMAESREGFSEARKVVSSTLDSPISIIYSGPLAPNPIGYCTSGEWAGHLFIQGNPDSQWISVGKLPEIEKDGNENSSLQ